MSYKFTYLGTVHVKIQKFIKDQKLDIPKFVYDIEDNTRSQLTNITNKSTQTKYSKIEIAK